MAANPVSHRITATRYPARMGSAEALLQPPGFIWACLLLVSFLAFRKKAWLAGFTSFALAAFIWLIGATPFPAFALARLERPYDRVQPVNLPSGDVIVMLGGAIGFSSRELLWFGTGEGADRILTTVELVRQGRAKAIVLGGAKYLWNNQIRGDNELVAAWMRAWRLPVGEVHLLPICRDTHDEAVHAAELIRQRGWKRVILVSSAYHLNRGAAAFRKAGVDVTPVGCDYLGIAALDSTQRWSLVPRYNGIQLFQTWLHEELGSIWYWWRGWI